MDLQLRITTDIESLPAAIEFNYPELKAAMESYLEKFKGLVVTEDAIKRAKDDRAEINKVVAAISRARIDTKARWLAPMESFEAKAKELEELGKSTARGIDAQLAEFEKRRVDEKRKALTAQFANRLAEAFGDDMEAPERKTSHWREFFAAQTDPKTAGNWLNKSVSETKAAMQMNAEIQRCKTALASLAEIYADEDAEVRTAAKFALCRRFDMADAASEVKRFKEQRAAAERMKAEEERKRREAEEARAEEERRRAEAMERAKADLAAKRRDGAVQQLATVEAEEQAAQTAGAAAPATAPEQAAPQKQREKSYWFFLKVQGTFSALTKIREAMAANGVTYEVVEHKEIPEDGVAG